ncbi:MAG: hypothetical protein Q9160_006930 [Pyrenula sp. 1 TL-2023]
MDQISGFNRSILFLSLRFGLNRYVVEKFDSQVAKANPERAALLLREALCQFIFGGHITGQLDNYDRSYYSTDSGCHYEPKFWCESAESLLARNVDPNLRLPLFDNRPQSGEDLCSPWEMMLDLAVALPADHRKFMVDFEREDSWSSLFTSLLKSLVIHGAEPNTVRVSRLFSGSAMSIVERLLTPSWYITSSTSLSPACRAATDNARTQLTSLLTERSAVQREWLGGKLISRPAPSTEAGKKGRKKQALLSVKDATSGTPMALSSSSSLNSLAENENSSDERTLQQSRSKWIRGVWAKFAT